MKTNDTLRGLAREAANHIGMMSRNSARPEQNFYDAGSACCEEATAIILQCLTQAQEGREGDKLLLRFAKEGGAIVSSDKCSVGEITMARACGRWACVDSLGFVLRPTKKAEPRKVDIPSAVLSLLSTQKRLSGLSAWALVQEVLETPHADSLAVIELMNRVYPGWEQHDNEPVRPIPSPGKEDGEDTRRLDWLQSNPGSVYASVDPDGNRLQHFCAVPEKDQNGRRGYVAPTVREAIDSARAAQSAPNEGRKER
jgi:hypothetical protein